jgi:hypothetical protein
LEGPWAADRIMDELEKLDIQPRIHGSGNLPVINRNIIQPMMIRNILSEGKAWIKYHFLEKNIALPERARNWGNYKRQRLPTIVLKDIRADLKRLQEITGRFSNVQIYLTDNNQICFFPSEI